MGADKETLRAIVSQFAGKLGNEAIDAIFDARRRVLSAETVAQIKYVTKTSVDETAQTIKSGAGKLFGYIVKSPSGANDDAVVSFFDNSVLRSAVLAKQADATAVAIFGDGKGVGLSFATNLTISAKKADNSTSLDTADEPDVLVLYA